MTHIRLDKFPEEGHGIKTIGEGIYLTKKERLFLQTRIIGKKERQIIKNGKRGFGSYPA